MAVERMRHRIWADQDQWERWVGHFTTSRGIRRLPITHDTREQAMIAAGEAMCDLLDQQEILATPTPPRGAKKFAVMKVGRRHVRLAAIG